MRALYLLLCVSITFLFAWGCGGESGSGSAGQESSSGSVGQESGSGSAGQESGAAAGTGGAETVQKSLAGAAEKASEQVKTALAGYKREALGKLTQYEEGLGSLEETAKRLDHKELKQHVDRIHQKLNEARSAVMDLEVEKLADLDAHRKQLDSKLNDIRDDLAKVQEEFSDLTGTVRKVTG